MDRSEKEVVRAHHRNKFRSLRKVLFHLLHLGGDFFIHGGCIGTCCLEYHVKNGRFTIHFTTETIGHRTQLHIGHVFQAEYRTVALRTDHRILKFFHALQPTAVFHGKLEHILRTFAQRTGRSFNVLLAQHGSYIRRNQAVLCHPLRLQPDTHTIGITQLHNVSYPFDTFDLGKYVNIQIVGKEGLIVTSIVADHSTDLEEASLTFLRAYTDFSYLGGQQSLCLGYTVLYIYRRHVGVGALFEVNLYNSQTGIGSCGSDIHHILHTIDTFFQRHDNAVHHCLSIGTRILGAYIYRRRRNVRILLYRQRKERNKPYDQNQHGDGYSHHRPLYKYVSFHNSVSFLFNLCTLTHQPGTF